MTLDRGEVAGTGAAILFHLALVAALSLSLARVASPVEPPSMEVELVDEVGLTAAAPSPTSPAAQAAEIGEAPLDDAPSATGAFSPAVATRPALPIAPTPEVDAAERRKRQVEQAKAEPNREAPRVSRLDDDFLKGIPESSGPAARPAAPAFDATAIASIQQAIRRQIQPCADRQVNPGNGANRIRVTLNLRLSRAGRLIQPPRVVRTTGVDDENARFEDRVKDLAVSAYVGCAPLTGLPADLYQTAQGGWSNINMTYRLP